jgi:NOL1/NOP2/fmu family ribosome biogenesis protein
MNRFDPMAVEIFARNGIVLVDPPKRDFTWSHDGYLKSEPEVKDIEIRIHEGDYMGRIVYLEAIKNVHFSDADKVADDVLKRFKEGRINPPSR